MSTLTVTAKGQITLKRDLLQHLGIAPGQQVEVSRLANGVLALHARADAALDSFVGCLPPPQRALSIEEMNALTVDGWSGRR
jgi:bifunctional DNA-binding transcriptional regulator/antitoxin component of YhaV-PrlF toxin-antitoxin module